MIFPNFKKKFMEKYVTNITDLVIQALTNGSEIKAKAESDDALSCFQMGMIHLLGINTPIDFKKAGDYLGNRSLKDDSAASRLLGLIAECEGNYSRAFKNFANAERNDNTYINKVFDERKRCQDFIVKLDLPNTVFNKEISVILEEYVKGGNSQIDASIKIANICNDTVSFLDVAQLLYAKGNYISAKRWLQKGNIDSSNTLSLAIEKKLLEFKQSIIVSDEIQIVNLGGNSLLTSTETSYSFEEVKHNCDKVAVTCVKEWKEIVSQKINTIKKKWEEEEKARVKKEESTSNITAINRSKEKTVKQPPINSNNQQNKKKESDAELRFDNVHFSTDGRKTLFMEFEIEYNREFAEYEISYDTYIDNNIVPNASAIANGCGIELPNKRELFKCQIPDWQINKKTNTINSYTIVVEARKIDEAYDDVDKLKSYPLIASYTTNLKLYFEAHMFGKNVFEIRN